MSETLLDRGTQPGWIDPLAQATPHRSATPTPEPFNGVSAFPLGVGTILEPASIYIRVAAAAPAGEGAVNAAPIVRARATALLAGAGLARASGPAARFVGAGAYIFEPRARLRASATIGGTGGISATIPDALFAGAGSVTVGQTQFRVGGFATFGGAGGVAANGTVV